MSTATEPLVGVVTPVYNGAKYLGECIESVLAQSHPNWVHVVCDNRSTDGSAEIAELYSEKDPRIRVERNHDHVGFLQNWNRAIRGLPTDAKYCKVLHADDRLYPECLEKMVGLAQSEPSAGVIGAYRLSQTKVTLDSLPAERSVVPGKNLCRELFLGDLRYLFGSPTSTLFRADLVRSRPVFYDESFLHADSAVCYDLLQESDFGFVHQVLTYTRLHPEAVTSYTKRIGSYRPEHLRMLVRYGPGCLSPEEYERRLAALTVEYLRFLGRNAVAWRRPEFREFHRRELRRLRHLISASDLGKGIRLQLARLARQRGNVDEANVGNAR